MKNWKNFNATDNQYEKEYIMKDGTKVPIELLVHQVKKKMKPDYYYSFINDIGERRKAENLLYFN